MAREIVGFDLDNPGKSYISKRKRVRACTPPGASAISDGTTRTGKHAEDLCSGF